MTEPDPAATAPDVGQAAAAAEWPAGLSRAAAFGRGLVVATRLPGVILMASCSGFGALARDAGLTLGNAVAMMLAMFALPAQVVLTDQLARGGAVMAGALAVTLTGIRLLPMVVTIMPYLREERRPGWRTLLAVHGVAITAWIEGMRRLPDVPQRLRLSHFLGISGGLVAVSAIGTVAGFLAAGALPPLLAAVLLFLTPIYFMISMLATARVRADYLAIIVGGIVGPLAYLAAPGFDLLAAGVVGGSIAHLAARNAGKATASDAAAGGGGSRGSGDPSSLPPPRSSSRDCWNHHRDPR